MRSADPLYGLSRGNWMPGPRQLLTLVVSAEQPIEGPLWSEPPKPAYTCNLLILDADLAELQTSNALNNFHRVRHCPERQPDDPSSANSPLDQSDLRRFNSTPLTAPWDGLA